MIDTPFCAIGDLSLRDAIAMLASPDGEATAVIESPVDASEVFVESFLRSAATERPVRCTAQIVGRVEFRAGEGPLFEIGVRAVMVETTWAEALFSWWGSDGRETVAMPLSSFSRYIVQGCVVLDP